MSLNRKNVALSKYVFDRAQTITPKTQNFGVVYFLNFNAIDDIVEL